MDEGFLRTLKKDWRLGWGLALSLVFARVPAHAASNITAIWANTGEDKVTRDELRMTRGGAVQNSVWDGTTISVFGARNEVVAFNVILEAGSADASDVTVSFNQLTGPSSATIASIPAAGDGVFNRTHRNIELFYIRYLQILGLSKVSYETYDERHIPQRFRRPWTGDGYGSGTWQDRPDHDKFYPDIAVPLELVPTFNIAGGSNQSVWVDIYIPKTVPAGIFTGNLLVREGGTLVATLPVRLKVYNFTLPDTPSSKTMLLLDSPNIDHRYLGSTYIGPDSAAGLKASQIRDRHFMVAHRHRISLIGDVPLNDCDQPGDQPCPDWKPRLDGSLFTAANGYDGPGVGVGNNVYSVGTYGNWSWNTGTEVDMSVHTNAWVTWFTNNAPGVEYFLYLIDESPNFAQIQQWALWILNNRGPGGQMRSMATTNLTDAAAQMPALDIPTTTMGVGISAVWEPLAQQYTHDSRKRFYMYNGTRPASGSTATEDDGVALRERAWGQYKKDINRWFFWDTTYYNNYQGGTGETNVFETAQTFGGNGTTDPVLGQTGWNYSNGDGVLFYPGTDQVYPADSYNVAGPFASLRLKYWRRGIQDVDYLTLAAGMDPNAVQTIVNRMVPKVLWEYGVSDPNDPSYVRTDISWSNNPDVWEAARLQLATIIAGASTPAAAPIVDSVPIAAGVQNLPFKFQITASNNPTGFTANGLPGGLAFDGATGNITGTPVNAGISTVTVTATNAAGTGTANVVLSLYAPPHVVMTKSVTPDSVRSREPLTYTIAYQNTGGSRADQFTITDVVPAGATVVPGSISAGGTLSGNTITWTAGTVDVGVAGAVNFQATVHRYAAASIINTASGIYKDWTGAPYAATTNAAVVNHSASSAAVAPVTLATPEDINEVRVYPNPWRSDKHGNFPVTFDHLAAGSVIKIFTIAGKWVKTLPPAADNAQWDLTNDSGDRVASGIYLYLIINSQGQTSHGKLAIIR